MNAKICNECKKKEVEFDKKINKYICNNCGTQYEETLDEEKETPEDEYGENEIQLIKTSNQNNIEDEKEAILLSPQRVNKNLTLIQTLLQENAPQRIIEETKYLYCKIIKKQSMKGRNLKHIIIAIYYYALHKNKMAKSIKEISNQFNIEEDKIEKAINYIKLDTEDECAKNDIEKNYIESFIGGDINRYTLKFLTYEIIDKINMNDILEGKNPSTVAGLSLILSCKLLNDNLYHNEDFYVKFSCKKTLIEAYEEIKECLNNIIPAKYIDKINDLNKLKL